MSNEINIIEPAKENVNAFMRSAPTPQRLWYLTRGEPACMTMDLIDLEKGEFYTKHYPSLRGIIVGEEQKTPELCIEKAAEKKADMLKNDLEPVNEIDLDISGEDIELHQIALREDFSITNILHIGTMANEHRQMYNSEDFYENIDWSDLEETLPFLADCKNMTPQNDEDDFWSFLREKGALGFILEVAITDYSDGRQEIMAKNVYGGTYAKAVQRAAEWAEAQHEKMRKDKAA